MISVRKMWLCRSITDVINCTVARLQPYINTKLAAHCTPVKSNFDNLGGMHPFISSLWYAPELRSVSHAD